ncbi:MAG: HdeD family acid-resistance protein [Scytonematopsis contorta HA4267-MV1]|jgi:uncharacterized membrane protein HdeD (DUF308 family)|nr:HdeD family acid-resistance protein [Scytonematopsis contorta HA4267-MV1]
MTTNVSNDIKQDDIKKNVNTSLIVGALLIILGIIAVAQPAISTVFAVTWLAVILASAGFAKLFYAFDTRSQGGFVWKLLLGILYIATGFMLLYNPLTSAVTLTLLVASFLFTEGIFELILAFRLRPQQNWTWALGNGIVTLLLGAMIGFQWPFNTPWVIGTLVGVSVIFSGVSRVMLSLNARSALSNSDLNSSDQATSA